MSHHTANRRGDGIDPVAVTELLRELRSNADARTEDADAGDDGDADDDRFVVADPDDPVAYVYELPDEGPLEHVDTVPVEAAGRSDGGTDGRDHG